MDTLVQVTLKETKLRSNTLTLTVIDSHSNASETFVEVQVLANGDLEIGGKMDQWCLGEKLCVFLTL